MPDSEASIPKSSHELAEELNGGKTSPPKFQAKQRKQRASRAGTRSVASLTPKQLERKRANDRTAQKSIRQRTKTKIDELEQRVDDLTRERQHGALEIAQRHNQELEEELAHFKNLLAQSAGGSALSPDVYVRSTKSPAELAPGPFGFGSVATGSYNVQHGSQPWFGEQSQSFPANAGNLVASYNSNLPSAGFITSELLASRGLHIDTGEETTGKLTSVSNSQAPATDRGISYNTSSSVGRSRSYSNGGTGMGHNEDDNFAPTRLLSQSFSPSTSDSPSESSSNPHNLKYENTQFEPASSGSRDHSNNMLVPFTSTLITLTREMSSYQHPPLQALPLPIQLWDSSLTFLPPIGQLDNILHHILTHQRSLPYPASDPRVSGVLRPSVRGLVQPWNGNQEEPISHMLCQLLMRVSLKGLAEQIACLVISCRFFQWVLDPCQRTWEGLPDFMRPEEWRWEARASLWISMLVWPPIRTAILSNPSKYRLASEELEYRCISALVIEWPYEEIDMLSYEDETDVRVSQAFMNFIWKLESWKLDGAFGESYPELVDLMDGG